jgi:hypothetical protein
MKKVTLRISKQLYDKINDIDFRYYWVLEDIWTEERIDYMCWNLIEMRNIEIEQKNKILKRY